MDGWSAERGGREEEKGRSRANLRHHYKAFFFCDDTRHGRDGWVDTQASKYPLVGLCFFAEPAVVVVVVVVGVAGVVASNVSAEVHHCTAGPRGSLGPAPAHVSRRRDLT